MDIQMTDVTIHIEEELAEDDLQELEDGLRQFDGVISVHHEQNRPHLMLVEYNVDLATSRGILNSLTNQGLHAELIGL